MCVCVCVWEGASKIEMYTEYESRKKAVEEKDHVLSQMLEKKATSGMWPCCLTFFFNLLWTCICFYVLFLSSFLSLDLLLSLPAFLHEQTLTSLHNMHTVSVAVVYMCPPGNCQSCVKTKHIVIVYCNTMNAAVAETWSSHVVKCKYCMCLGYLQS